MNAERIATIRSKWKQIDADLGVIAMAAPSFQLKRTRFRQWIDLGQPYEASHVMDEVGREAMKMNLPGIAEMAERVATEIIQIAKLEQLAVKEWRK